MRPIDHLNLIVTLAAEVEDRLGGGEIAVRVGGKTGRQTWKVCKVWQVWQVWQAEEGML